MWIGLKTSGWITMTVLASLIALYATITLFVPRLDPPFVTALRAIVPWAVVAHLAGGIVAMAVGPWQLNDRLRARSLHAHRWMGRSYVVAVLVGGIGALLLAPLSQEGLVTHIGFGLLAILWLYTTLQAYRRVRVHDRESHRRWMIRSFALTLAAVTLRIYLPLSRFAGIPFHDAYQVVSWFCWVPNLIAAEWIGLRASSRPARIADAGSGARAARV